MVNDIRGLELGKILLGFQQNSKGRKTINRKTFIASSEEDIANKCHVFMSIYLLSEIWR